MPAMFMAMMLAVAGQDVATLRVPPPPAGREFDGPQLPAWAPGLRYERTVACAKPARGELVPYDRLPTEVLVDLRRTDPKMSPPGGPFNATDAWDGASPFTRVVAAMRRGDRLALAYERGGRGYGVTVLTYDKVALTGLLEVSGVHPLVPEKSANGWDRGQAACEALEWALGASPPHP